MGKATGTRIVVLGVWLVMVAFDPTGTYKNAPMIGSTLLPLLLIVDGGRSPWLDWQGALPVDRQVWLRREFLAIYGEQVLLLGAFWALVAVVKAGPDGWAAYGTAHLGTILAGLTAVPWFVAQGLEPREGPWLGFGVRRWATFFAVILVIAALGGWWEGAPGWVPMSAILLACGASLAGAWFRARSLLFRGDQG